MSQLALPAVRWCYIPHRVPYLLGLALQEHLVSRRLAARAFLEQQPTPSPTQRLGDAIHDVDVPSRSGESSGSGSTSGSTSASSSSILSRRITTVEARRLSETDHLLLLQHAPVFTQGRRKGAKFAEADEEETERLRALGAEYVVAQRGGLITYHGPGQMVGYPIWDLAAMQISTRCYVDMLQRSLSRLLHSEPFRLATVEPPDGHTGVWSDELHKIASIGIQLRHRIASHGFALNVEGGGARGKAFGDGRGGAGAADKLAPRPPPPPPSAASSTTTTTSTSAAVGSGARPLGLLEWFSHIVACGIEGRGMTAVDRELRLADARDGVGGGDAGGASAGATTTTTGGSGMWAGRPTEVTVESMAPLVASQLGETYSRRMERVVAADVRPRHDGRGEATPSSSSASTSPDAPEFRFELEADGAASGDGGGRHDDVGGGGAGASTLRAVWVDGERITALDAAALGAQAVR